MMEYWDSGGAKWAPLSVKPVGVLRGLEGMREFPRFFDRADTHRRQRVPPKQSRQLSLFINKCLRERRLVSATISFFTPPTLSSHGCRQKTLTIPPSINDKLFGVLARVCGSSKASGVYIEAVALPVRALRLARLLFSRYSRAYGVTLVEAVFLFFLSFSF